MLLSTFRLLAVVEFCSVVSPMVIYWILYPYLTLFLLLTGTEDLDALPHGYLFCFAVSGVSFVVNFVPSLVSAAVVSLGPA